MTASQPIARKLLEGCAVIALYALAALLLLSPAFDSPSSTVIDPASVASRFFAASTDFFIWSLAWCWHALSSSGVSLLDTNILPPTPDTLAAVFPPLGHLPLYGPLRVILGSNLTAHQYTLLANFALSGASLYALLRHLGTARSAALFGGFVYALCPARVWSTVHPGLTAGQYLPLAILFIDRTISEGRWRDAVAAGLLLAWQASCALAYAILVPVVAAGALAAALSSRSARSRAPQVAVAGAIAALAVVALMLPSNAAIASGRLAAPHDAGNDLVTLLAGAFGSLGDLLSRHNLPGSAPRVNRLNLPLFVGWSTLIAIALGIARSPRSRQRPWLWRALLLTALASVGLGLGLNLPGGGKLWSLIHFWAPLSRTEVVASEVGFGFILGAAIFAGFGIERLLELAGSQRNRIAAGAILLLCLAWETNLLGDHIGVVARSPRPPRIYSILRERPAGAVLELPQRRCQYGASPQRARAMYHSTAHWRPLIDGYGQLVQPSRAEIDSLVSVVPNPKALAILARTTGLRYLVVRPSKLTVPERNHYLELETIREIAYADGQWLLEVVAPTYGDLADRFLDPDDRASTLTGTPIDRLSPSDRVAEVESGFNAERGFPGMEQQVNVVVRNTSSATWPALGGSPERLVRLAARWVDDSGAAQQAGEFPLPFDLEPGESVSLAFCLVAPKKPGAAHLEVGVTQGDDWFAGPVGRATVELGVWKPKPNQ